MQPPISESDHGGSGSGHTHSDTTFFAGAQGVHISGGTFVIHRSQRDRTEASEKRMKMLDSRAEVGAPYDAAAREDVPKCHENTRLAIIDGIHDWAHFGEVDANPFMWMYGPAGSGKTTIMQTVAGTYDNDGSLAASFFFSRLSAERPKTKKNLAITIAHQLSLRIPSIKQYIGHALEDSSLLDKSLVKQMDALIIGPLNALKCSEIGGRYIIMVDGLDECEGDDAQKDVLDVFHHFSTHVQHPFRFLIASRPLSHIQGYFSRRIIAERTQTMPLDNDYESYADIEAFIISQFQTIKEEHPSRYGLRPEWPLASALDCLVSRSSGQFIYASVVMKYISDHSRHPETSLQTILDVQIGGDTTPYKELDAVYTQVMSTVELESLPYIMDVLGCLILDYQEFTIAGIAQQKPSDWLDQLFLVPLGTTDAKMSKLRPLLTQTNSQDGCFTFAHASFPEYLCDLSRSGSFFLDFPQIHCSLARRLLRLYSTHLKIHGQCGVDYCQVGKASCWIIPIDENSRPASNGHDVLLCHGPTNVVWHCSQAKFTAELQQDILSFDFQAMLKVVAGWDDGPGFTPVRGHVFWKQAVWSLNFTVWLEERALMLPADIEIVRSNIQHGVRSVSSEMATTATARLIGIYLAGGFYCGERWKLKALMGSLYRNLEWFGPLLDHQFGNEHRDPDKIWDCSINIVYPRSEEAISQALAPRFGPDGRYIDDGPIYSDIAVHYSRDALDHMYTSFGYRAFQTCLPAVLSKMSQSEELAGFVQDHLLQVPNTFLAYEHPTISQLNKILVDKTVLFTATCIYLSECGVPYMSNHHHKDTFVGEEGVCGICELFLGNAPELTDTELSVDPAARPSPGARALIREVDGPQNLPRDAMGRLFLAVLVVWLQRLGLWIAGLTRMSPAFPVAA